MRLLDETSKLRIAEWFQLVMNAGIHDSMEWCLILGMSPKQIADCVAGKRVPTGLNLWSMHFLLRERYSDKTDILTAWHKMVTEDRRICGYVVEARLEDVLLAVMSISYDKGDEIMGKAIREAHEVSLGHALNYAR